jgi:peptidoglycan/xylan/chitin deacetylase (PgdA/CDA1 family)
MHNRNVVESTNLSALVVFIATALMLLFFIIAPSQASAAECPIDTEANLIPNPCLEIENALVPLSWATSTVDGTSATFTYPVEGFEGVDSKAARVLKLDSLGDAKWYFAPVPVTPNSHYIFTARYQSDVTTEVLTAEFNASVDDEYAHQVLSATVPATSGSDWGTVSFEIQTGANTNFLSIYHLIRSVGSLTIDQASLQSIAPPTVIDMVPNNSVEEPSLIDPNTPRGWVQAGYEAAGSDITPTFTYIDGDGHSGSRSVKVEVAGYGPGEDADAKWMYMPEPVAIGDDGDYKFTAWYKTNTVPRVVAQFTIAGTTTPKFLGLPNPRPGANSATDWQEYTTQFSIPTGATHVTVFFFLKNDGWIQSDDYHIDPTYSYVGFSKGIVSLTFDDGHEGNVINILPVLQGIGAYTGINLPTTQCFTTGTMIPDNVTAFKTATNGNEICAHTVTHPDLTTIPAEAANEIATSKTALEAIPGVGTVTSFASPFGAYNDQVISSIQSAGFRIHRTVDEGFNSMDNLDPMRLRVQNMKSNTPLSQVQDWVNKAAQDKTWLILVYHRVLTDENMADNLLAGQPAIDPFDTKKADFDEQMTWLNGEVVAGRVEVKTLHDAYTFVQNTPPTANDQSVSVNQNASVGITLTGNDADSNPITFATSSNPSNGTLSGSGAALTYTPNTGFVGSDSFTFIVNDGLISSNIATVSISVASDSACTTTIRGWRRRERTDRRFWFWRTKFLL